MPVKHIYLNSRFEFYRVDISRIVYFESNGNFTSFVLVDKQRGVVCMSLLEMQRMLTLSLKEQASTFARIGKRFIINLAYVYHIEVLKQKLTLSDGDRFAFLLPVSKEALKKLKDLYVASGTCIGTQWKK